MFPFERGLQSRIAGRCVLLDAFAGIVHRQECLCYIARRALRLYEFDFYRDGDFVADQNTAGF